MIHLNDKTYQIVHDHKEAWNPEAFRERYSEVLDRYDYIVGDWGYNQLRLKGFFKENSPKANKDTTIASLQDYLNEYCNFGCAYFVIERIANPNRMGEKDCTSEGADLETDQEEAYEREERRERAEQGDRGERRIHRHRYEQGNRHDNGQRSENGSRNELGGRNENNDRNEHGHRNDNGNRHDNGHKNDQGNKHEQGNRNEHLNRNDQGNRNAQGGSGGNRDRGRHRDRRFRGGRSDKPPENKQSGPPKDKAPIV